MTANRRVPVRWLTRNVVAIGMLSLFSDMNHELVTAVLPLFLATFGAGAIALGTIEGVSDAAASLLKLWMSAYSDRVGHRKPVLGVGYVATALLGTFAFVTAWWQLLVIRAIAWMGRGARGPVRNALLSESVPAEAHGRAFGFEGAMDTLGAVLGPAIALSLVGVLSLRHIFLLAFIPGIIAVLIAVFVLREVPRTPQPALRLGRSLRELPREFRRYAAAVGVFGLGNFAHTLLILRAVVVLTPTHGAVAAGRIAVALYILHNVVYAAVSYPAGVLGDRISKRALLATGYGLFALMCIGFVVLPPTMVSLVVLFVLAGIYIAIVDAMERSLAAGLLPVQRRGVGYGALGMVNSIGDLVSSIAVGWLWTKVSVDAGFAYATLFTGAGAIMLVITPTSPSITAEATS
jgi:MFS family permease